jgi:aryl-alcohol dehydrogenase-like predicted oxidoreductase
MRTRRLGRTGLEVGEIGFGAWGIGKSMWVGAEDETSLKALMGARDAGVNFFDTALAYGTGHSERLLRKAFGASEGVFIASKVPPRNFQWPARAGTRLSEVFPRAYVLESLDSTLRNLGRERVDIYQFHVWLDEWASHDEWLRTVEDMKTSGKARLVGISINDHEPANSLKGLATGQIDTVQVIYNLFDQSPEDRLLPYCREHGIGVIVRVPFDEGSLTGRVRPDTEFPRGDFRNEYFRGDRKREVWERVQAIVREAGLPVEELPELALRFCLSAPEVSTVIPGMRTWEHVAANVRASEEGPLAPDLLERLRPHRWVRSFYG